MIKRTSRREVKVKDKPEEREKRGGKYMASRLPQGISGDINLSEARKGIGSNQRILTNRHQRLSTLTYVSNVEAYFKKELFVLLVHESNSAGKTPANFLPCVTFSELCLQSKILQFDYSFGTAN